MKLVHILNRSSGPLKVIATTDRLVGDRATEKHRVEMCRACDGTPLNSGLSKPPEELEVTFEEEQSGP